MILGDLTAYIHSEDNAVQDYTCWSSLLFLPVAELTSIMQAKSIVQQSSGGFQAAHFCSLEAKFFFTSNKKHCVSCLLLGYDSMSLSSKHAGKKATMNALKDIKKVEMVTGLLWFRFFFF